MTPKAIFGKDYVIFGEIVEIIKNIAHLYNKSIIYNKKESQAIRRLKDELEKNDGGMAIKMPSRNDCEKLFQESLQEAGILSRRIAKVMQILLGVNKCQYADIIKMYEDKFGLSSDEVDLLKQNQTTFDYLLALRGEFEHPKGEIVKNWLVINTEGDVIPAIFIYKSKRYIVNQYLTETADFLFFLTEFLIATGISYRMPGIKYGFNPNPKEGEFRWQPYMINKIIST
ncbi:MAG: hypothetical protein PHH70_03455 [Candidatus Gracilibacteria bacterium]|nr:hypothetical protein [Candidatus Gracilibacteria bacterium]